MSVLQLNADPHKVLEEPIRAEIFGLDRFILHAESLAAAQTITTDSRRGLPLAPRVRENGRVLVRSYQAIARAIRDKRAITPAAEWLVDNFHIVDEQIREIRDDLPPGYYRQLPKLAHGHLAGYPRVYGVAWAFVAHTDSRFDPEALRLFVSAYQRVQPLTIGELWAVAITMRVVLVENLRRLADRIVLHRAARDEADALADSLLSDDDRAAAPASSVMRLIEQRRMSTAFAAHLVWRLRDLDPRVRPVQEWLDQRLAAQGTSADEVVREEHQRQGAASATMRNIITSMRLMSSFEWSEFFESVSQVDAELRKGGSFATMDFTTRDLYRHAIEELSRGSGYSEIEVARAALRNAAAAAGTNGRGDPAAPAPHSDPGFYLVSKGRPAFERELGFRAPLREWPVRAYVSSAATSYLTTIGVASALMLALPVALSLAAGMSPGGVWILALLAAIPASDFAIAIVQRAVSEVLGPLPLPRLDLSRGLPAHLRTIIVMPTLLTSRATIEEQVERLGVHYLANADDELRFALLSDWADAPEESTPTDDELLAVAVEGIARLNALHGTTPDGGNRFLLLHRRRLWNAGEGVWMGWERKRGKLHELNQLMRGSTETSFIATAGTAPSAIPGVRFVITLDADTRLPRGAAHRLIGTMAHPLNRPRHDPTAGRVVEGYAIVQPRITPSLPTDREGSLFQKAFSGPSGLDPYAAAVSDVYQDLFQEGSYTGKGIYEIDAFEAALTGKVPDNTMLSHDLFEGTFARAALASDIELIEEFPTHFEASAARQHRWARGDWQLLPWLIGAGGNGRARHTIPLIGRWKMLDNLRRTLAAPAAFTTLVVAWTLRPDLGRLWTAFILATMAIPSLMSFLMGLAPRRVGISKTSHVSGVASDLAIGSAQFALNVTFLAHHAAMMADAIGRTLVRMFVTHRKLLEWVAAAQTSYSGRFELAGVYRRMIGGVVLAIVAALVLITNGQSAWMFAAPIVGLWLAAPAIARWISLPPQQPVSAVVTPADRLVLRATARRTWQFFERFVTAEDNALPPDNFQELPLPVVAHRTSPTNIGLYLLSTLAARDLGWIGTIEMLERVEATIAAMKRLELVRGHLYNWYDTRDLRPLEPRYVSSVDSGNLAGNLLVLANACRELISKPEFSDHAIDGAGDALQLLRSALAKDSDASRERTATQKRLGIAVAEASASIEAAATNPHSPIERFVSVRDSVLTVSTLADELARERGKTPESEIALAAAALRNWVESHARDAEALGPEALDAAKIPHDRRLTAIAETADRMFHAMDFTFLYDGTRHLFSIGFRPGDNRLDEGYYDLLASEARLTSFIAIAKGDIPSSHWFRLGRPLTPVGRGSALISWSGSMFEYLMPELVMRTPPGSLLRQTCERAVKRHIEYGSERRIPWGVSESAYNVRDFEMTYQYSNFGVPGLGLQRGLREESVVAPYATALAAMFQPAAAVANLARLTAAGGRGAYGYYEALDYTPSRLPEGDDVAVVRAYMAHHQGMSLIAITNVLCDGVMRARFHTEPMVQATELLLQERTPRDVMVARPRAVDVSGAEVREVLPPAVRRFTTTPHDAIPRTHLMSNGRYSVMLSAAGSGYSRWRDLAVTRWREDATRDCWGTFLFLRDANSGSVWSAGHQPAGTEADFYEASFSEDHAEIIRHDRALTTMLEVVVSSEDDAETRRVSITNLGTRTREIEITSYAELCLAPQAADVAHAAFSNLFVQTEFVPESGALLATRRRRAESETPVWVAHVCVVEGNPAAEVGFETDRSCFIGRGRDVREPAAVFEGKPLSGTVGSVLDPILSLRCAVKVAPGETAHVAFSTMVATDRGTVLHLSAKYRDPHTFERTMARAWTQAQVQLHHIGVKPADANIFQRLAAGMIYSDPTLRPPTETLIRSTLALSALWAHGISSDRPIVLCRIDDSDDIEIVRELLRAHEYWRMKGMTVDVVILNEHPPSYVQALQAELTHLVHGSQLRLYPESDGARGSIYLLRAELLSAAERLLLQTVARVVLLSRRGSLSEQVIRAERAAPPLPPPPRPVRYESQPEPPPLRPELQFFNGLGGFAEGGREYVTLINGHIATPRPWVNVIANPDFGFLVSESGSSFTWSLNSHENRLTPWSNDPVSDPSGEVFYFRDEASGEVWCPTALPVRDANALHDAHHGQGYSRFRHTSRGISSELLQFVPPEDPVKITRISLKNLSGRTRRISIVAYVEWVLGESRGGRPPHVITEVDAPTSAVFARSAWSGEFGGRIAFADLAGRQTSWTGDRTEFLGRNGSTALPRALRMPDPLSGKVGAGLDPCAALRAVIEIRPGARADIVFLLGETADRDRARELIGRYRKANIDELLREVTRRWDEVLGAVQISTPEPAMDLLVNRWLLYQALSSRIWARAGFYQAGGAYGFRDQLQDMMALSTVRPDLTRAHLLRAAARQFVAGDVQHWWHPPSGRGVRTRISDDLLWLPYAVNQYIEASGDHAVLGEIVPFLDGEALGEDQHESYFEPRISNERASLFEHCARTLDRSLAVGSHGLPLMGTGDWNDGMNRVGEGGQGESVWLGWFLHTNLRAFAPIAEARNEPGRALAWRTHMTELAAALERHGWDGGWYRRAYFDDGTPLGTDSGDECRIDSIAQSWAVLSGAADPERAVRAMSAVESDLIRPESRLVLLFTPPFDRTPLEPGYIKGYVPGIRENGGQYTHAAVWTAIAFAELGDGDRATAIFQMINPILHTAIREDMQRYGAEPYVVAADVYAEPPHTGRGGWTWYTGAAGWLHRAGVEWILGVRLCDAVLYLDPAIPRDWPEYSIRLRHHSSTYEVRVENPHHATTGVESVELDGARLDPKAGIKLVDDGGTHRVRVVLGPA